MVLILFSNTLNLRLELLVFGVVVIIEGIFFESELSGGDLGVDHHRL